MSDAELRRLEREAAHDPAAAERLGAARSRLGVEGCPQCGGTNTTMVTTTAEGWLRHSMDPCTCTAYCIRLTGRPRHAIYVVAPTPEEAIRHALNQHRRADFVPEAVEEVGGDEEFEVVGSCESCRAWLLSGRDEGHAVDGEGTLLCTPCYRQAQAGEWCPDCDHETRVHDENGCRVSYDGGRCECDRPA